MRVRKVMGVLLALVLLLVACGPSEDLIETAATDMNLAAADLGGTYELTQEQGLEELREGLTPEEAEEAQDANLRLFVNADGLVVVSIAINFKSVSAAKANMRNVFDSFEESLAEELSGAQLEELTAPSIGEEAVMAGASSDLMGMSMNMYMVSFRKSNVIGIVMALGFEGAVDEDMTVDVTKAMEAKVK